MTKIVNLFSQPGAGKSTVAAGLFEKMKWNQKNVELIDEAAKKYAWEGRLEFLSQNQLYVSAEQNLKITRLIGITDFVISDSPLLLGLIYFDNEKFPELANLLKVLYNQYDNINILLNRTKPYVRIGRSQTEEESNLLAHRIRNLLIDNNQKFISLDANENTKNQIFEHIFGETK